jgi:hypothetical protein
MTEFEAKLERFETLAADCDLISKLTTDKTKRELYLRLGLQYRELAGDMRTLIAASVARGVSGRDGAGPGVRSTH